MKEFLTRVGASAMFLVIGLLSGAGGITLFSLNLRWDDYWHRVQALGIVSGGALLFLVFVVAMIATVGALVDQDFPA